MSVLWYQNLYVSEKANKHINQIKWKIRHCAGTLRVYLITMPSNEKNSLDIWNAAYIKQSYYKKQQIRIVGVAVSYEEAIQLLLQIVEEVYENTKGMDIKDYLLHASFEQQVQQDQERWQV